MVAPRIIIHGGAGPITRENLPPDAWHAYRTSLLSILHSAHTLLTTPSTSSSSRGADALTVAVHAVRLLEENPLFNCAHGAVFTREGTNELEASVMVSRGYRKRGAAVSMIRRVKSPITLAAEMLKRGEEENGGGAQGHQHISGAECERLAEEWGVELCDEKWFWTRRRWEQHLKGLEGVEPPVEAANEDEGNVMRPDRRPDGEEWSEDDPSWDGNEYIPRNTVGCVVLDHDGVLCCATSTGGLTNKLSGRIGDTPTFGAGFWAEEWLDSAGLSLKSPLQKLQPSSSTLLAKYVPGSPLEALAKGLMRLDVFGTIRECFASPGTATSNEPTSASTLDEKSAFSSLLDASISQRTHAIALSGTGNGDTFLRLSAASTVSHLVRFTSASLQRAVSWMADPNGELQRSAGPRWGLGDGEGEGGLIGIELVGGEGKVVAGFNKAMFRAWVDGEGKERCMVFKEDY